MATSSEVKRGGRKARRIPCIVLIAGQEARSGGAESPEQGWVLAERSPGVGVDGAERQS